MNKSVQQYVSCRVIILHCSCYRTTMGEDVTEYIFDTSDDETEDSSDSESEERESDPENIIK